MARRTRIETTEGWVTFEIAFDTRKTHLKQTQPAPLPPANPPPRKPAPPPTQPAPWTHVDNSPRTPASSYPMLGPVAALARRAHQGAPLARLRALAAAPARSRTTTDTTGETSSEQWTHVVEAEPTPKPLTAPFGPPDPMARWSTAPAPPPPPSSAPAPDPFTPEAAREAVHSTAAGITDVACLKALLATARDAAPLLAAAHAVATSPRRVPRAAADAVGAALAARAADMDVDDIVSAASAFASAGVWSRHVKAALAGAVRDRAGECSGHALARALRAYASLTVFDSGVLAAAVDRLVAEPDAFDAADVADIAASAVRLGALSDALVDAVADAAPALGAGARDSGALADVASALASVGHTSSPALAVVAERVAEDAASFGPSGLSSAVSALIRSGFGDAPLLTAADAAGALHAPSMTNADMARLMRAFADAGAPAPAFSAAVDAEAAARVAAGRLPRAVAVDLLDAANILGSPAPQLAAALETAAGGTGVVNEGKEATASE